MNPAAPSGPGAVAAPSTPYMIVRFAAPGPTLHEAEQVRQALDKWHSEGGVLMLKPGVALYQCIDGVWTPLADGPPGAPGDLPPDRSP